MVEFEISRRMPVANRTSGDVNEIAGSYTRGERINLLLCIWLEVVTNGLKTGNVGR